MIITLSGFDIIVHNICYIRKDKETNKTFIFFNVQAKECSKFHLFHLEVNEPIEEVRKLIKEL